MKEHRRLVGLLTETMNLTTTEAEAALRGVEAEAVARCGGAKAVIRRALALRQTEALRKLMRRYPGATDKTFYAIELGYRGKRRVILSDGKVVSHGHADWHAFCGKLSAKKLSA